MKRLTKILTILTESLEYQEYDSCINYRHNHFTVTKDNVLFNNFTKATYLLDDNEMQAYKNINLTNNTVQQLLKEWCVVPEDFNELQTYDEVKSFALIMQQSSKNDYINTYTILPTTDCNARCFYCYEHDCEKMTMEEQTAKDIAKYINRTHNPEKTIKLSWFGGEPLFNTKVIDTICNNLNCDFESYIITNGYLFDKQVIAKAKNNWQLKRAQITLDGPKDIYNNIKNYKVIEENDQRTPFERVIDNIELLVEAKISVNIRININKYNINSIEELIDNLCKRFNKFSNTGYIRIYAKTIFQEIDNSSEEEKENWYNMEHEMNKLAQAQGLFTESPNILSLYLTYCMADSDNSVLIMPDGSLRNCENISKDSESWGSIYTDKVKLNVLNSWKEKLEPKKECYTCPVYPSCMRLKKCPANNNDCNTAMREHRIKTLKRGALRQLEKFNK